MKRRNMLKMLVSAVAVIPSVMMAYDKKLVVNTIKMKPKDSKKLEKGEKKHLPEIKVGDKDSAGYTLVEVTIGQDSVIHPSTKEHWIYEIELFADGKLVDLVSLEPEISRGYLGTRVKLDGVKKLSAVSKCNLHGSWESEITL